MIEQVIYGRWEYPIGNSHVNEIFTEYRGRSLKREDGIIVGGLSVVISGEHTARTAIILTFDRESDTFMKLYLLGKKDVRYRDCLKEKLEWEEFSRKQRRIHDEN